MIRTIDPVRHNSVYYQSDSKITEIKEEEAQRLVDLGVAFFIGENQDSLKKSDDDDTGELSIEEYAKSLEENLSFEELKELSSEAGIQFNANIGHKTLIDRVIEEGKQDEILEKVEEFEEEA